MSTQRQPSELTEQEANSELERLAKVLTKADSAYHEEDEPTLSDAEYDALKRRNVAIEALFPLLKRTNSPSERVGAPASSLSQKCIMRSACCHLEMHLMSKMLPNL